MAGLKITTPNGRLIPLTVRIAGIVLGTNQKCLMEFVSLANALYLLVDEAAPLEKILEDFQLSYQKDYHTMMLSKLD
jgi:hypothetical protein